MADSRRHGTTTRSSEARPGPARPEAGQPCRWLLFVHQLPATPSHLRVRTWRRLQKIGALALKQAVHVLPDSPTAREHFEWLKAEVTGGGGDASVFSGDCVDRWSDDALVDEFRRARQDAYAALAGEIEDALARVQAKRPPPGRRRPAVRRLVDGFSERLSALERIDFFGSAGRERVSTLLRQLEGHMDTPHAAPSTLERGAVDRTAYANRLWVTRPRPGVDRMGSAWLIRRFIDPQARFAFAADRDALPSPDAVAFDMFGVDFSHRGESCTFETLCAIFGLDDPALASVAAIVHDLDLKDDRFAAPEAATVSAVIDGLQLATAADEELLQRGIVLFEALYQSFARRARPSGPRPVAKARPRGTRKGRHGK